MVPEIAIAVPNTNDPGFAVRKMLFKKTLQEMKKVSRGLVARLSLRRLEFHRGKPSGHSEILAVVNLV